MRLSPSYPLMLFAAASVSLFAPAWAKGAGVEPEVQKAFDEAAVMIGSGDPALIDAKFTRRGSLLFVDGSWRMKNLSGQELLSELGKCTYAGGRNLDGLRRMVWSCEGRELRATCFSGDILMHLMWWSETDISVSITEDVNLKDKSCWPEPPKRIPGPVRSTEQH